jgi:hypothetical protein
MDDGRHFLNRCARKYDAVILDAFLGDSSPSHLMSREAFTAMREVLRPGGVLVINTFADTESGKDFLAASLDNTLKTVFRSVQIHGSDEDNVFFVASDQPALTIWKLPDYSTTHPACQQAVENDCTNTLQVSAAHGMVLTDDYNPVDYYDAANREELRRSLTTTLRKE